MVGTVRTQDVGVSHTALASAARPRMQDAMCAPNMGAAVGLTTVVTTSEVMNAASALVLAFRVAKKSAPRLQPQVVPSPLELPVKSKSGAVQ